MSDESLCVRGLRIVAYDDQGVEKPLVDNLDLDLHRGIERHFLGNPRLCHSASEKFYVSAAGAHELRRDAEQGGLPCSIVAKERDKFARSNFERNAPQCNECAETALDTVVANA